MSIAARWRRWWPHLRALLILFHIAAILLMCTPPAEQVLDRNRWRSPVGQTQFETWASRLEAVGIDTTPAGLESWLWERAKTYARVRRIAGKPFDPYVRALNLHQGWALFTNPQRRPAQVVAWLHTPGRGWETIYAQRSEVFDYKREQLDNHRLRKLAGRIARRRRPRMYSRLATWLARSAARDFPEADRLRVMLFRYRTHAPGAPRRLTDGRFTDTRHFVLEQYR